MACALWNGEVIAASLSTTGAPGLGLSRLS